MGTSAEEHELSPVLLSGEFLACTKFFAYLVFHVVGWFSALTNYAGNAKEKPRTLNFSSAGQFALLTASVSPSPERMTKG